jgi:hypothetical protein
MANGDCTCPVGCTKPRTREYRCTTAADVELRSLSVRTTEKGQRSAESFFEPAQENAFQYRKTVAHNRLSPVGRISPPLNELDQAAGAALPTSGVFCSTLPLVLLSGYYQSPCPIPSVHLSGSENVHASDSETEKTTRQAR